MAESTLDDLNRVLQGISGDKGSLSRIASVCATINGLNELNGENIDGAKVKAKLINKFCTQGLKTVISTLNGTSDILSTFNSPDFTKLSGVSGNVKDILSTLSNYDEQTIPLLASAKVPKYVDKKIKDSEGNEIIEKVQDGFKLDTLADGLVSKVILASGVIKKYTNALQKKDGSSNIIGGLQFELTNLKDVVDEISSIDVKDSTLNSIAETVRKVIETLSNYDEQTIPLLAVANVPKYVDKEIKDSEGNKVIDKVPNGSKPDISAVGLVSKVILASSVIKKYTNALQKKDGSSNIIGGLQFELTNLKDVVDAIGGIDVDYTKLESLSTKVKNILATLNKYNEENFPLLASADGLVSKVTLVANVIKTYAIAISEDNGEKGLVANLKLMNDAITQVQSLDISQINETNFKILDNTIVAITDAMIEFGQKYDKKSGDRLAKSLEGLLGYTTVDEKDKVKTTNHTGVFTVISTFSKSLQTLFEDGGTFEMLSTIDFSKIDQNKIQDVFNNTEKLISIVIDSLQKQSVESDDKRLLAMYGEEYMQNIQNITNSINSILTAIIDITDPKKNPLIGNPIKLALVKRKVKKTFKILVDVVDAIIDQMKEFYEKLNGLEIDKIVKSYDDINKIFTSVNNIFKAIIEMPKLILDFIIAAPIVISGLIMLGIILGLFWPILKLISLIKFDQIAKDLSITEKAFKKINEVFKNLEILFMHITILALAVVPALVAALVLALGLEILVWIFPLMTTSIRLIAITARKLPKKDFMTILFVLGAVALIMMALMLVAYTIQQLGDIVVNIKIDPVLAFIGGLSVFILALIGVGTLMAGASTPLLIAAAAVGITVGAILAITMALTQIAKSLEYIQNCEIDSDAIGEKTGIILLTVKDICTNIKTTKKELDLKEMNGFKTYLRGIRKLIKQVFKLAKILDKINKLVIDGIRIKKNITAVFTTANDVISSFGDNGNILDDNGNQIKLDPKTINNNSEKFKDTLSAFNDIFDDLGELVRILNDVQKVKLNETAISNSISAVFQSANNIIATMTAKNETGEQVINLETLKQNKKDFAKISTQYESIFEDFKSLTDIFANIDFNKIQNEQNGGFVGVINKLVEASQKLEAVDSKKIGGTLGSYEGLLKRIDNTNLSKLETSTKLFEQMAKFSESINDNFEQLAEVLNDKIAPMMEELKELLDGVQQKVEKNGSDISSSVFTASRPILSKSSMIEQAKREMPQASQEEQERLAQQRLQEQIINQNNNLASKFDELIDLFKNGIAQVRMA